MRGRIDRFFSKEDREAIRSATAAAERKTSGELVVYLSERCDPYSEIGWKAALLGGALGAVCAALTIFRFGGWGAPDYLWILIGLQLGLVSGWLASRFDPVARRLLDREALDSRLEGRVAEAFLGEQVFATRGRTGVLIFVALFEHRVRILADDGIDAIVEEGAWDTISEAIAEGLRRGAPAQAVIEGVERCADLLLRHGIAAQDAANELSDEPRLRRD